MAEQDPPKSGGQPGDDSWTTYSPPVSQPHPETPAEPTPETLPPTHVPYGTSQNYSGTYPPAPGSRGSSGVIVSSTLVSTKTKGCGLIGFLVMLAVFGVVAAGVVAGIRGISGGFDELTDGLDDPFSGLETFDMQTVASYEAMLDALREETGSTTVFEVGVYAEYAIIYTPADKTSKRNYNYYFDGEIRQTSQGTTENARFDASTIDPAVIVRLLEKGRTGLVEDPTSLYLSIRAPREYDKGAWFYVHASNDFMESGYFTADKTGKTVMEYVPPV